MLTQEKFDAWCRQLHFSEEAKNLISEIRTSPPGRRVGGGKKNVSGRYPSRKMGVTIQFESHKNEFAAILDFEYDTDTLEYFDQPHPPIKLHYKTKNGKSISALHTADFFVIRKQSAGWVECKTESDLEKLAEKSPYRYHRDLNGLWRCIPGEEHAKQFGLTYIIRSSKENDHLYLRNLEFLEDYLRASCALVTPEKRDRILSIIKTRPGISIEQILLTYQGIKPDDVYSLLARQEIYIDLNSVLLIEQKNAHIYPDKEQATKAELSKSTHPDLPSDKISANQTIIWDGISWTIMNIGESYLSLLGKDGNISHLSIATFEDLLHQGFINFWQGAKEITQNDKAKLLLAQASPDDLKEANRRHAAIFSYLKDEDINCIEHPIRTIQYWIAKFRNAEEKYGNGLIGLLPHYNRSGNRKAKLPENTKKLLEQYIADNYETLKQQPILEVYGALIRDCESRGISAPSYRTFRLAVKSRPRFQQIRKRKGPRAAYANEPFYYELDLSTPRHGDRPLHICHIDHTELDIELVCSITGRNLGRPWVTFITDAYSRLVVAIFLSYDPPSYRSCMMAIRECVRRHGRFPQILVVDGGKEFESIYFETLLARYQCTKKTRPGGKPRFGSVIERLFNTTNSQFIHNLSGNTQIMKNVRQVTKSVNPKQHACWTLSALYERLCQYAYEIYGTIVHPTLGQTPQETFAMGLQLYGHRGHQFIPYDDEFRILTLPTTQRGVARVSPGKGIKINHIHYWNNAFRNPEVEQTSVPVRYDPYDVGTAYAYVRNNWVSCISEYYTTFHGRSEKEMMALASELRKRRQNHSKQFNITAKKLAEFLSATEADEILLSQQLKDKQAETVIEAIAGKQSSSLVSGIKPVEANLLQESEEKPIDYNRFEMYEEF